MADGLLRATGCDAQRRNPKSSAGYNDVEPRLFLPNLAFSNPNLDRRGFSRASSTSSWEMQPSPVSFQNRLDTTPLGYSSE
jgi:hypothetical protein